MYTYIDIYIYGYISISVYIYSYVCVCRDAHNLYALLLSFCLFVLLIVLSPPSHYCYPKPYRFACGFLSGHRVPAPRGFVGRAQPRRAPRAGRVLHERARSDEGAWAPAGMNKTAYCEYNKLVRTPDMWTVLQFPNMSHRLRFVFSLYVVLSMYCKYLYKLKSPIVCMYVCKDSAAPAPWSI